MTCVPDDREVFKVRLCFSLSYPGTHDRDASLSLSPLQALHECMKDIGKFRQYIYYIGTSCDTNKLRAKIRKLRERIHRSFYHQHELIRKASSAAPTT